MKPTSQMETPSTPKKNDATVAGRGFLLITGAKLWFMVGGALITFGLPFIFQAFSGDGRKLYGQYYDLNNILSIFSMMMVTGVMQTVSRFVAERPESAAGVVAQAQKMMLIVGGIVGLGFVLSGDFLAASRNNPHLGNGYRAAGVILFCYGIYTVYIGALNGQKRFLNQAMFDIGFTTLKATLVLGMAAAGLGVLGAFYGFACAAVIIMVISIVYVRRSLKPGEPISELYSFAAKVMLYTLVFNLIFKLDALFLKPLAASLFGNADGVMADYGMAVNVSRLPWQATIAITFVIFPMMSEATFTQDLSRARIYIRQTLRYSTILVGSAVVVLMAMPDAIFSILPDGYEAGAIALVWLAPAYFSFSLFNIVNTLLMSSDRAGQALGVGCVTIVLTIAYFMVIQQLGPDVITSKEALIRLSAMGTFATFTIGLILGLGALWRRFGSPMPLATVVRVLLVGVVITLVGRQLPEMGKIMALTVSVGAGLLFLIGLVLTGEFGAEDKARFAQVLRGKK
ncbi:MAG: hypothetical protein CMH52_11360 [Myxococcales bacterium]|nr:hypothetical protein [Myxococcales bacterium]